ncbi:hypothetical protein Tdes44962_MAKER08980 [Teratosphaeria destructans]|uniref:Uncharacterized protein n=1 Tax=Teratosphaeria destructans TaxID=418781 RepID=A0A9W7W3I5_9PEZI|nr:hypothetical protein Tdes44962_MAKER08980 [Teratosphaeria destructans]
MKLTLIIILLTNTLGSTLVAAAPTPSNEISHTHLNALNKYIFDVSTELNELSTEKLQRRSFCKFFQLCGRSDEDASGTQHKRESDGSTELNDVPPKKVKRSFCKFFQLCGRSDENAHEDHNER